MVLQRITCCAALIYIFLIRIHFWNLIICFRFAAKEYQSYKHRSSRYWFNIFFLYFYFGLSGSGEYYFWKFGRETKFVFIGISHIWFIPFLYQESKILPWTSRFTLLSLILAKKIKKQHGIIESPTEVGNPRLFLFIDATYLLSTVVENKRNMFFLKDMPLYDISTNKDKSLKIIWQQRKKEENKF